MSRKREQADLLFKLGQLLGPPLKAVENPTGFDQDEKARIFARFFAEFPLYIREFHAFTLSEKGHDYSVQYHQISAYMHTVRGTLEGSGYDSEQFASVVRSAAEQSREAILSIPIPLDSTIYEARTPFSTYCLVKDICSTAKTEIIWLDRYFDQGIFHRYFTNVPSNVIITLVTWPQSECKGPKDIQRYQEFMDLSKLFAQERALDGYRLITNVKIHARWLRCDDKYFSLGDSIKDIAKDATFTISRLDNTPDTRKHFDEAIANGVEVFGKNQPIHP
jgi:hypothetical protein